ncbi:scavenger receptor cysteine-rich type 1 protein M130 [Danio aesculapii]|uniref:scavenger receptor cysteine-rich type 1 protein M130 n=1 Tax=Danio aesculapii TaxID=1142201 RepID=UPI0024BFDBBC|nr:scavenger receptor cysteine-rich type 1 protein M130 [Danio aesculapii]
MWLFDNFNSCSGTVAVFHNGSGGAVCASDDWDLPDATVVCREIGCWKSIGFFTNYNWSSTPLQTWMSNVNCTGEETALSSCAFQGWGPDNCAPIYAGVICSLPVRLIGGSDGCSGLVEVFHDGQWGTVNADGWDLADAAVVCRELGCGDAAQATGGAFGQGIGPVWMTLVDCVGSESSLIQCSLDRWLPNHVNHLNDAGVVCTHSSSFSISSVQDSSVKVLLRIKVKTDARFNPNNLKTLSKIRDEGTCLPTGPVQC